MTADRLERVEDRSAWRGCDLRPDEYVYELSSSHLAEIATALRGTVDANLPLLEITRERFPLPTLGAELAGIGHEVQFGRGFALVRGLPRDDYTDEQLESIYWGIGSYLGTAVPQNARGDLLGHVRDEGRSLVDPSARGYQTSETLQYHSDDSDVVALLCLRTAKSGGLSSIVSAMQIHNDIFDEDPDLLEVLYGPFYRDHRGEEPEGSPGYFVVPVFSRAQGFVSSYYGRPYIESAHARFDEIPDLTREQVAALDLFDEILQRDYLPLHMAFQPGDMQFLSNSIILHSRTAYEDHPEPELRRHLLRLWLAVADGRPMAPQLEARRVGGITLQA